MPKKFQRELLRDAYAIIDGVPARRFNLNTLVQNNSAPSQTSNPNHCGTIGCAIGWLSMHPQMQALGLTATREGGTEYKRKNVSYSEAGAKLFGISHQESRDLFGIYYGSRSFKKEFQRRAKAILKKYDQGKGDTQQAGYRVE